MRIVTRDDLAFRLVIQQYALTAVGEAQMHQLAIDADLVLESDALADMRRLAIDTDATGQNPFLQLTPRTVAGIGQRLVQLGRGFLIQRLATPAIAGKTAAAAACRRRRGSWRA